MTLKTFWSVLIKLIGLYLIWQLLILLPSIISIFAAARIYGDGSSIIPDIILRTVHILVIIFIIRSCLFRTDDVIIKLRLMKGNEDERIEVNIHRSSLLKIAIIVLGGLLLADSTPFLGFQLISYFENTQVKLSFIENRASPYLVAELLKVIIGYFMVTDSRLIVNFIERKRKKAKISEKETEA